MKATTRFVEDSYARFNGLCFGGELPPVRVVIVKARSFLGKVVYRSERNFFGRPVRNVDFTLRISSLFDLPEREWEDVVLHEMIHCDIARRGIRDTSVHGVEFRKTMAAINEKYGRNITVRHRCREGQLPPKAAAPRRPANICVSQLRDGNWGVTLCSDAMLPKLRRALPRFYSLRSAEWSVTSDPFFDKYPRSRTPKIYKISLEELKEHLLK